MINPVININITQTTPYIDAGGNSIVRTKMFTLNVCNMVEVYSTWKNLTDTATITLPKNLYVIDENNNPYPLGTSTGAPSANRFQSSQNFISGFPRTGALPPLFMRGDKISIDMGYYYPSFERSDGTYAYQTTINNIFNGFIAAVDSKTPLKLHCEDNMWKCKQVAATNKNYPAGIDNMGQILADFTAQTGFKVDRAPDGSPFAQLNIGNFRILNETWAKVFERIRKDKRLYFYFRGNILRGGGIVYYPQDQGTPVPFVFQKNIIKDELTYKLKTDVNIGAVCYSTNKFKQAKTNAAGNTREATSRLEAYVNINNGVTTFTNTSKETTTEYFTFFFTGVSSVTDLQNKGALQLAKYYYTGYHGKFTTFGLPTVIHGNIVSLSDNILPERNGNYLAKGVKTIWGVNEGYRQEIELHFRTDNLSASDLNNGL